MNKCFCSSQKEFSECCEPFIKRKAFPKRAEELMRSRYSAYVVVDIDYLIDTTILENRNLYNSDGIKEWATNSNWQKLEIVNTIKGGEFDEDGVVEFRAYYLEANNQKIHHEISNFKKINGVWYYVDGIVKNDNPKIGRNEPCLCGSGKKYKKCCFKGN